MPIRPENRDRYPADWPEIRARILRRAGNRCERLQAWEHGEGAMDEGWLQLYLLLTGQTTVARARQALTAGMISPSPL